MTETPLTRSSITPLGEAEDLPRDTARFSKFMPEHEDPLPENINGTLSLRSSLQMATEGHDTPNWFQPDPWRPASLDEVCAEGHYLHVEPDEDQLDLL